MNEVAAGGESNSYGRSSSSGGQMSGLFIFVSWWKRPTPDDQRACLQNTRDFSFNYPEQFKGFTATLASSSHLLQENNKHESEEQQQQKQLANAGYAINRSRCRIGRGRLAFEKAKHLIAQWRHFQLEWAVVESGTCIKPGQRFCVCTRELFSWLLMPLEILYVHDSDNNMNMKSPPATTPLLKHSNVKSLYSFGSGTIQGHLLAGEEMFSVQLDDDDDVWYEILSFSKPAHVLASIAQPYIRAKQKIFAWQSVQAMSKALSN